MRYVFAIMFLFVQTTVSFAQTNQPVTEVIIIGTIHSGNDSFNHKTLYQQLVRLQPDIILEEYDKPYKRVFGLQPATFLKIAKPPIEQLALQKYSRKYKQVNILPYDTAFLSRRQYVKNLTKTTEAIYNGLNMAVMSDDDSLQFAEYATRHNDFYTFLETASLYRINQPDVSNNIEHLADMQLQVLLPLAKKYIADSTLVNNYAADLLFWNNRNDYMAQQIKHYIQLYPGRKLVVLTGLKHKYFLQKKLLTATNLPVRLTDMVQ